MRERRYDIDWIRVIAVALLMVYHIAIVFQPWGLMIGFITNDKKWESLWIPMAMLNIWRIPILFFVSGMGFYFSFQNRNVIQVIKERVLRIGIPYLLGIVVIAPLYLVLLQTYYDWKIQYLPQSSHLWFLGNILCYIGLTILPFYYLKSNKNGLLATTIRRLCNSWIVFPLIITSFIVETVIINPSIYEMYALSTHGFVLGFLGFFFGYLFAFSGEVFWYKLLKLKWLFLCFAILFYTNRIGGYFTFPLQINLPMETCLWIFSILAFAKQYLNTPHRLLSYLSKAAYPVYILHMIFLGLACHFILPLKAGVLLKFFLLLLFVVTSSLLCYEFAIRRNKILGFLFGLRSVKIKKPTARVTTISFGN